MKKIRLLKMTFALVTLLIFISCGKQNGLPNGEGFLEVTGGKIWFRVSGQGDKTPILMLHGGPGYPGYYLNPLMELGKERQIITFDQLGCGRSDRISDTTLMTVDAYVEQTRKLLTHLGVTEFYLYGHSWGTMLGTDYYLKYKDGIKGLILASPCLNSKRWAADADTLISTLPDSIAIALRNEINGLSQDPSKLNQAIGMYFRNFYTRKRPVSADINSSDSLMGENVYQYMWGTSEFFVLGTLKNYDRINDLKSIDIRTLYITGEYDAARPTTVKYYQSLTPDSRLKIIANAGHMTMHDNPSEDIRTISDFLNELDNQMKLREANTTAKSG